MALCDWGHAALTGVPDHKPSRLPAALAAGHHEPDPSRATVNAAQPRMGPAVPPRPQQEGLRPRGDPPSAVLFYMRLSSFPFLLCPLTPTPPPGVSQETLQTSRDQSGLLGEPKATLTFSRRVSSLPRPGPTTRACSRGSHCSTSRTASGLSLNKEETHQWLIFTCSFPLLMTLQTSGRCPPGSFSCPRTPFWPPPRPYPPPVCSLLPAHQALPPTHTLPPALNTIHPALLLHRVPPGPDKSLPVGPLPLLGPKGLFSTQWPDEPLKASGSTEPLRALEETVGSPVSCKSKPKPLR